jgi:hypothetical protein
MVGRKIKKLSLKTHELRKLTATKDGVLHGAESSTCYSWNDNCSFWWGCQTADLCVTVFCTSETCWGTCQAATCTCTNPGDTCNCTTPEEGC